MTGFTFDPWTALKMRRSEHPPANTPNLANPPSLDEPRLGAVAGLAGGCPNYAKSSPALAIVPGVPAAWCEGVARLVTMAAPGTIKPVRWAALATTSTHLLRTHGAELHRAGWDALDLFGLHQHAPVTNPAGWGLAWLLGNSGDVLDVAPNAIGMRRRPNGARLTFRRGCAAARAGVVPAWALAGRGPAAT